MFHQANLRVTGLTPTTINGRTATYSLLQSWVETVLAEMLRLVDWPFITLKHDDICQAVIARMKRDLCMPTMSYTLSEDRTSITGLTVGAGTGTCSETIPVTVPGGVTDEQGSTREQVGDDELTLWVSVQGGAKSFEFAAPFVL